MVLKNVKSVLIIEDDDALVNMHAKIVKEMQVPIVDTSENGQVGFDRASNMKYDLVILDWMVPGLTGLAVLNRLKKIEHYLYTPVLVVSGMLKKKDFSILGDFPLCALVEKPFESTMLSKALVALVEEAQWYKEQLEIVTKLVEKLEISKKAFTELTDLISSSPNPAPLAVMIGRFLRQKERLEDAEQLFKIASQNKEAQLMALNELGKTYLLGGKNKEAKAIFTKVLEASPNNLERLCNLGNLSLKEMDVEGAGRFFQKAEGIDAKDEKVASGKNLVFNINSFMDSHEKIPKTYGSLLNAIGISFVRTGDIDKGIEHYKSALEYIEDKGSKAKLSFNLGLGYAKWHRPDEALNWFQDAKKLSPDYQRADHYIGVMKKANKKKQPDKPDKIDDDDFPDFDDADDMDLAGEQGIMPESDSFGIEDDPVSSASVSASKQDVFVNPDIEINEDPQSKEADDAIRALLIETCPRIETLFTYLTEQGVYVKAQLPLLRKLLNQYGKKTFNIVITQALEEKISSVVRISNMFSKHPRL